ncbi:Lrp/AsnC family transcriptional regulator [Ruegeria sp. 2205SS24-7]|uniref:Lrp/AsnC family transcriptional regulator n=1 Tax=Ruegeria discodermiae TaxID=3064389 RepID=UPI0027407F01|nr:Lrp/AsnC family transcriptional regulator [Ruegeria sp. 2205SS24-7]MDP5220805.1 Lrp/AsnC family transcriptional regulator [Ruegeria sp. 2205SS24-7]
MSHSRLDELDTFDQKLIVLLQGNARQTGDQLSEQVGLSSAACLRRVQRLRKIGAIEREVAVISPEFQAKSTSIIVFLTVSRLDPKRKQILTKRLLAFEEVERIFSVTGEDDFVLFMKFPSITDFTDFADAHFYESPIEGYESTVVLREFIRD